jgi:hypothetical protein
MVNATATAAAMKTAIAAASTVMQVATLVTSPSRRALKAARRAGRVGIAGRESNDIGWSSSTPMRGKPRLAVNVPSR